MLTEMMAMVSDFIIYLYFVIFTILIEMASLIVLVMIRRKYLSNSSLENKQAESADRETIRIVLTSLIGIITTIIIFILLVDYLLAIVRMLIKSLGKDTTIILSFVFGFILGLIYYKVTKLIISKIYK
jgi:uncharacterized membrane protein